MVLPLIPILFGTLKFADQKIVAFFLVLSVLVLDSGQASLFGNAGAIGIFFSWIISLITGLNLYLPSWFLLFLFITLTFLGWFMSNS